MLMPSRISPGCGVSSAGESDGVATRPARMLRMIVFVFMVYFVVLWENDGTAGAELDLFQRVGKAAAEQQSLNVRRLRIRGFSGLGGVKTTSDAATAACTGTVGAWAGA